MKNRTLELLCCPSCHSSLSPSIKTESGILDHGYLFCSSCSQRYPIQHGIVHFIDSKDLKGPNQRFARYYDRLAPVYSIFSKLAFFPFGGERKARKEILDRLDFNGGRMLEVSIGNGVNLPYLSNFPANTPPLAAGM